MLQVITANTILYCAKWEETVAFYKDVLKLEIGFANDWFVEFNLNRCARLSVANEAARLDQKQPRNRHHDWAACREYPNRTRLSDGCGRRTHQN